MAIKNGAEVSGNVETNVCKYILFENSIVVLHIQTGYV